MIKSIIFDFDGVLFDSEPIHWRACNLVFQKLNFTIPYDEYLKKYVGLSDIEMFPLIFAAQGYKYGIDEIKNYISEKIAAYNQIINSQENISCVEGLLEFLRHATKFIDKFAICSGSTRQEINTALAKLELGVLQQYFPIIITAEDVMKGKPSPEGYLKAAKNLGVAPENCLVIEDTPNGIKAAKSANMKVVALTTTHEEKKLADADFVAGSYKDIFGWLNF